MEKEGRCVSSDPTGEMKLPGSNCQSPFIYTNVNSVGSSLFGLQDQNMLQGGLTMAFLCKCFDASC